MTPPYPDEIEVYGDENPCPVCNLDPCICDNYPDSFYDDYNDDNPEELWENEDDELDNERRNDL